MTKTKRSTQPLDATADIVVASADGRVQFCLRRVHRGLLVQRERRRPEASTRVVHSTVFADTQGFARWCDSDSVRFDYPMILSTVRRRGDALLQGDDEPAKPDGDHGSA